MELKDLLLIILATVGWLTAIIQYIISQINQRKEKIIERKYIAYSDYMKKYDEINNHNRNNINSMLNMFTNLQKEIPLSNPDEMINIVNKFNESTHEYIQSIMNPYLAIKHELNTLLLICSNELQIKIIEMKKTIDDCYNDMQKCLNGLLSKNISMDITELQTLGDIEKWTKFKTINEDIIAIMRKEIGNK